jgi:nucleoid DNA-binding protein
LDAKNTLERIKNECGLSEDIIKRVQQAETAVIIDCLKHGERINITGRGSYRPEIRNKISVGGNVEKEIRVQFNISSMIKNALMEYDGFIGDDFDDEELPDNILTLEIEELV